MPCPAGTHGVLAAVDGGLRAATFGGPHQKNAHRTTRGRLTTRDNCQNERSERARWWWVRAGSSEQGGVSVDQPDRRRDAAKSVGKLVGDQRARGGVRSIGATTSETAARTLVEVVVSGESLAEQFRRQPRRPSSWSNRVVSKALIDVGGDPVQRREYQQPDADSNRRQSTSRRRLLMTALGGAVLAETAGQFAERTLISESARLRLQQKRRVLQESVESFADTEETAITAEKIEESVRNELARAGAISALALFGAVGSKVMSKRKQIRELAASESEEPKAPPRGVPCAESTPSSASSSATAATADAVVGNFADDEDNLPCLTGASCSPDWSSVDEDDEINVVVDAASAAAADAVSPAATASPLFKSGQDFDDVAKTVVFSACYGGFFQPHWFNVLNSYDWSNIILPSELDLQLRTLGENLQRGQTLQGVPAEGASFAMSQFLGAAGGYGDPSLVAAVSLSLAAPLEAAGSFLAPLAVNQLMAIPLLYWPSFFLFTGLVEGQPLTTILQTLHRRLPQLMKANLAFWIPAQGFQFSSVPVDDQAVYVAVMGVLWNGVLAAMMTPQATATATPQTMTTITQTMTTPATTPADENGDGDKDGGGLAAL